ncbi:MAG: RDD family protein [Croceibacterium sp.]
MAWLRRNRAPKDRSLRRQFVTPEGVDLRLDLAGAGERATAFLIDALIMLGILVALSISAAFLMSSAGQSSSSVMAIIWLLGFFLLRNGWFVLFELSGRGATPGKRLLGLRVVARDGSRLTGGAVLVRNAMREVELFLPLAFLAIDASASRLDALIYILTFSWVALFLFFPLFNRDRLRIGDLLAGTWVVHVVRGTLAEDLVGVVTTRERRTFPKAALDIYGIYELQTLEDVLRKGSDEALVIVAASIRAKTGLPDDGDVYGFLSDYYAALCARLERDALVGRRQENKFARRA